MTIVVKDAFTYTYGHGGTTNVPKGARTGAMFLGHPDRGTHRWVDPSVFPAGSIDRYDADHYGIRVPIENTEELRHA